MDITNSQVNFTQNQQVLLSLVEQTLLGLQCFGGIGVVKDNEENLYIAVFPRWIYNGMIKPEDNPEDFYFLTKMPGPVALQEQKDIVSHVNAIVTTIIKTYLSYGREIVYEANKESKVHEDSPAPELRMVEPEDSGASVLQADSEVSKGEAADGSEVVT